MERAIIHLNIADFAAAVETTLCPSLAGYPIVVAPTGAPRAVVYDMSDQAYQEGIRKGMPLTRVRQLIRQVKIIPPRFNQYDRVMKAIFKQAAAFTPAIETGGWDGHLFLDVTGTCRLFGPPADLAFRLKKQIQKDCGLTPIWSVASNKLVAKVATRLVKPWGEYIVEPGQEASFLKPLPITLVPGLSQNDLIKLKTFNLLYIFQILPLTLEQLFVPFAHRARLIYHLIRGIDAAPVIGMPEDNRPLLADHEFAQDTTDVGQVRKEIYLLAQTLCHALRQRNRAASRLCLTISHTDGCQRTATKKRIQATANEMTLFRHAIDLLFTAWTRRIRIRHIGLSCETHVRPDVQATLFAPAMPAKAEKQEKIYRAMDEIRAKFGTHAVRAGLTLAKP